MVFVNRFDRPEDGDSTLEVCHPRCVCENWKEYVVKHNYVNEDVFNGYTRQLHVSANSSAEKKTATNSEKQYTATTTTVCATTNMDIHPPRGKTGASWEHTNTRSVSKGPYIQGHSGLPATRPQLGGRKRNTPLHNTSAPRTFKLDTSHHTLSCL